MTDWEGTILNPKNDDFGESKPDKIISQFTRKESGNTIVEDEKALEKFILKYKDLYNRLRELEHNNHELAQMNKTLQEQLQEWKKSREPGKDELKRALKRLHEETLRRKSLESLFDVYKYALKNHPEAFILTDSQGKIEYVNEAFEKMTGWKKKEVKGYLPDVLKKKFHEPGEYADMWEKLRNGRIWTGSFKTAHKDGAQYDEFSIIIPVKSSGEKVTSMVIFSRQHTEKVVEKKAAAPDSKGYTGNQAFITKIARHFNNITTAIKGNTDLALMKAKEDNPMVSYIQEIDLSADQAMNITGQLLAYCGKQVLFPARIDLKVFLDDMKDKLKKMTGSSIDLKMNYGEKPLHIVIDPVQLEQVIENVVKNSVEAMPYGGTLEIATGLVSLSEGDCKEMAKAVPGEYANIQISDTGIGMNNESINKAFNPFYVGTEGKDSVGLGLSSVYGIISQSGGFINVTSTLGRGTTVDLYFEPIIEKKETPQPEHPKEDKASKEAGKRVMVIDDEEIVREIVREHLSTVGYEVFVASDAKEALEELNKMNYELDLLLTDVIMPGVDGFKLTEELKRTVPNLKIILMSGYIKQSISNEADGIINKPFKRKALLEKVEEVINQ